MTSDEFTDLRRLVAGENITDEPDGKLSFANKARKLMAEILAVADFVCTTPHASQDKGYKHIAEGAGAIVLDETGAMSKADALMVWGTQCRPCAMAGDERQLPPAVMDKERNLFYDEGSVSILEHFQRTSQPTFVLNCQMRIASGLFDLARKVIYSDVQDFTYVSRKYRGSD